MGGQEASHLKTSLRDDFIWQIEDTIDVASFFHDSG
jgi:hypothetical protein